MITYIPDRLKREIFEEGEATYPNECCGFFFGKEEEDRRFISAIFPIPNVKQGDQRRRFEISARDYLRAEHQAIQANLQLLGVYHSHPEHPAIPSEHDRSQAVPFFSYIITSIFNGKTNDLRSWRLGEDQQFEEEQVIIQ